MKPFVQARAFESSWTGTLWFTYIIAAALALALRAILRGTVWFAIGKVSPQIAGGMNLVISIALNLFVAIPAAASVMLMSGARLEDQLALKSSGITGIESLAFSADSFAIKTGLLLALLILVVRILKGFADSANVFANAMLSAEQQREAFGKFQRDNPAAAWLFKGYVTTEGNETITYAASETDFDNAPFSEAAGKYAITNLKVGLYWGIFSWLFWPQALSLVAMCLWLAPIGSGLVVFLLNVKLTSQRKTTGAVL